jgi:hypothetical protein
MTVGKIVQLTQNPVFPNIIPFSLSKIITLLEITRFALADADTYEEVAEELDLSDDYLYELRGKLQKFLDSSSVF